MYIPSAEMGDYEEARNTRKKSGPLYPLTEEGSYGAPPREKPKPRPPLPGYEKRERKAKVYASYAVSNECSMHSHKLDNNERATRGRTPPSRKDSGPSRKDSGPRPGTRNSVPRQQQPTLTRQNSMSRRSSVPRQNSVSRHNSMSRPADERPTKWQNSLREQNFGDKPVSWKDSLRGLSRDSVSPTPRQQRRPSSTMNRKPKPRKDSESASPVRRGRTVSSSPDRRRQSSSPGMMGGRGDKTSADWGYTDFSTFTANRRSSEYSQGSRKSSAMTDRSSMGRQSVGSREYNSPRDYSGGGRDYPANIPTGYTVANRDYSSSERDFSKSSRKSGDFSSMYNQSSTYSQGGMTTSSSFSSATYSKSTGSKVGLSTLKTPVINEWDDLGVLGLSSKMFKDSSQQQNGFMSGSSSSFMRRESVTTKVM